MVASRPVDSAPVATVWGQEIHDAVHDPDGVWLTGGATAALTTPRVVPLDTVVDGDSSYVNLASDIITIPTGKGGIYAVDYSLVTSTALVGTVNLLIDFELNGTQQRHMGGYSPMVASVAAVYNRAGHIALAAGDTVQLRATAGAGVSGGAVTLIRFVMRLVMQGW